MCSMVATDCAVNQRCTRGTSVPVPYALRSNYPRCTLSIHSLPAGMRDTQELGIHQDRGGAGARRQARRYPMLSARQR